MQYRRSASLILIRLDKGDEIISSIQAACCQEKIKTAVLSGIGGIEKVKLGYFSLVEKKYDTFLLKGQWELTSLNGNIIWQNGHPVVHTHVTLADQKGNAKGGHLIKARVWATAEIMVLKTGIKATRAKTKSGLNLIRFK